MKFNHFLKAVVGSLFAISSFASNAHDIYIWPSFFSVDTDKSKSVTVDITASHTTFRPDFSMPSSGVKAYGVDGKQIRRVGSFYQGAQRSTFDLAVEAQGTYGLIYERGPSYFSRYTVGKRETEKRLRASKSEAQAKMPKNGKNLETSKYFTVAMSYLTNGAPTDAVLQPKNKGFELVPVTHPADYVTGEEIQIKALFNGEPAKDLDFTLEKEGPQYQEEPLVVDLKSDSEGLVNFSLEEGGRFMLKVYHKMKSEDAEADFDITRVYYAFEVIYE
ncbi:MULTISPECIES: DUF4198 domain-containing protein [unclassified Pseudoalteromonas]|uniref:DUF4198 domain-containing protein n=1 Tax=unclassified Pseudoalteromonas TaxID=194690 RepID=UPI0005A5FC93|nr:MULTISPECIES: DUF4198 domain-containing protein [unclassified Pseudoalteromonas]